MAHQTPEKLGSRAAAILTGGNIGAAGGSEKFVLAVQSFFIMTDVGVEDTTADADLETFIEHNQKIEGLYRLRGIMVASRALGLVNLASTTNNPVSGTLTLGGTRELNPNLTVRRVTVSGAIGRTVNAVEIIAHMTNTANASIEDAVA